MSATQHHSTLSRVREIAQGSWTSGTRERLREFDERQWTSVARMAQESLIGSRIYRQLVDQQLIAYLPPKVREMLRASYLHVTAQNDLHTRRLWVILERAQSQGIRMIVLKGAAHLFRTYADPGERLMQDLDLLVSPADFQRALLLLEGLGYRIETPFIRGVSTNHGQEFFLRDQENHMIDLHHRVFTWYEEQYLYRLQSGEIGRRARPPARGDMRADLLCLEDEVLYGLLLTARVSPQRDLRPAVDLHLLIGRYRTDIDWEGVRRQLSLMRIPRFRTVLALLDEHTAKQLTVSHCPHMRLPAILRHGGYLVGYMRLLAAYLRWQCFKLFGLFREFFLLRNHPVSFPRDLVH